MRTKTYKIYCGKYFETIQNHIDTTHWKKTYLAQKNIFIEPRIPGLNNGLGIKSVYKMLLPALKIIDTPVHVTEDMAHHDQVERYYSFTYTKINGQCVSCYPYKDHLIPTDFIEGDFTIYTKKYLIPDQSEFDTWNQIIAKQGNNIIDSIDANIAAFYPITFETIVNFIQDYAVSKKAYPLKLEIFPTHICNHSCRMCIVKHYQKNNKINVNATMPFEKFQKIFKDAEKMGTQLITLSGGGEPSMHPEFFEILDCFRESKMNLMLFTNGTNIYKENCHQLIAMDAIINISLNAGNRKQYHEIAGVDSFEKVIATIKNLNDEKNFLSFNGIICVNYVIIPENVSGIVEAVKLASEMELDFINFKAASEIDLMFSDSDKTLLAKQLAEIQNRNWCTKVVFSKNIKIFYESIKRPLPVSERCFQGLISLNIDAAGSIYPCCVQTSKSIFKTSMICENTLDEFITSEKYQQWPHLINNKLPLHKGCFNDQSNLIINWMYDLVKKYPDIVFMRNKK